MKLFNNQLLTNNLKFLILLTTTTTYKDSEAMAEWCCQTFGPADNIRWSNCFYKGHVSFHNEIDRDLFILRWGR